MKHIIEEGWRKNATAREAWDLFIRTPEFKAGMDVLKAQGVPVFIAGESPAMAGRRQDFQAGFHMAIELVAMLPTIHTKKHRDYFHRGEI